MAVKEITVEFDLDDFDDEGLEERLEGRGFYVPKITSDYNWFEVSVSEWHELATYVALGETHDALAIMEYISNGVVNAVCVTNYAKTINQGRVAV